MPIIIQLNGLYVFEFFYEFSILLFYGEKYRFLESMLDEKRLIETRDL